MFYLAMHSIRDNLTRVDVKIQSLGTSYEKKCIANMPLASLSVVAAEVLFKGSFKDGNTLQPLLYQL